MAYNWIIQKLGDFIRAPFVRLESKTNTIQKPFLMQESLK